MNYNFIVFHLLMMSQSHKKTGTAGILIAAFCMLFPNLISAQDLIKLRNNETIKAKVNRAGFEWIYFTMDGKERDSIARSQVASILYANGAESIYHAPSESIIAKNSKTETGWADWNQYPLGSQIIGYGTIALTPVVTALPALVVSRFGPHPKHYVIDDSSRMDDSKYMADVKHAARKYKRKSTWALYGRGSIVCALLWASFGLFTLGEAFRRY